MNVTAEYQHIEMNHKEDSENTLEKHLTFRIDNEYYGIEILQTQEIIGLQEISEVPKTPSSIRGVINLRGKILPVLDLRIKFGLPAIADTERTCIIIIGINDQGERKNFGLVVDQVSEVVEIDRNETENTPYIENNLANHFFEKMAKLNSKVILLLDLNKVIFDEDKALFDDLSKKTA